MTRQRQILVTVTYNDLGCIIDTKAEPYEEPNLQPTCNQLAIDTISRQAAIELAMQYCPDDDGTCSKADEDIRNLLDELEDMPSAQPEIIRCRDCKHYDGRPCGIVDWYNTADDFCSRAERRTDGE